MGVQAGPRTNGDDAGEDLQDQEQGCSGMPVWWEQPHHWGGGGCSLDLQKSQNQKKIGRILKKKAQNLIAPVLRCLVVKKNKKNILFEISGTCWFQNMTFVGQDLQKILKLWPWMGELVQIAEFLCQNRFPHTRGGGTKRQRH